MNNQQIVFHDYAHIYDAIYKDKDYMSEAKDADSLLGRYGKNVRSLLIIGCGTGRHDSCFCLMGYDVHGIDLSPDMIEVARHSNPDITYEVADARTYEPGRKFDAVISLFHVMSYQNSSDDICNAFRTARKALRSGGVFLFDVWNGVGVLSDPPVVRVKEVDMDGCHIIRIANPEIHYDKNIVDVNYKIIIIDKETCLCRTIEESHHMRYFFEQELSFYLECEGFKKQTYVDCKTLRETDASSWTAYIVAEAV